MKRKSLIFWIVLIAIVIGVWFYRDSLFARLPVSVQSKIQKDIDDEAFLPPPLRRASHGVTGVLTQSGAINETNRHRAANGLPPLQVNAQLASAAEEKITDMFKQQYFAHRSPDGVGPSDLAATVHYDYLIVGENLALGDFTDDVDLLQAWMDSPGHRANILNKKYSQIGVAVRVGNFEGQPVWMAVQEFGLPDSACPAADASLGVLIDSNKERMAELETMIKQKKEQLDRVSSSDTSYNSLATVYNRLVKEYNTFVEHTKKLTEDYNAAIERHNDCLKKAGQ